MIEVFSKDNTSKCIPMPRWTNKTKTIFTDLFNDIQTANKYVETRKKDKGSRFYNITIQLQYEFSPRQNKNMCRE
jgi:hypothetical protein